MIDFAGFPKIARYSREVIVTEKIDGTNAQVFIGDGGEFLTGSRTRWIVPGDDNFGFSAWAHEHKSELMALGPGRHFGEWWGSGIQRGYGLEKGDKRWSLFNVQRWCLHGQTPQMFPTADLRVTKSQDILPACCMLVPIVWRGNFDDLDLRSVMAGMLRTGSYAAPGFMAPEGVVVFHVAGGVGFKKTFDKDDKPKSSK